MIGQALRSLLVGDPTVAALTGSRIRPQQAAQDDPLPRVVYHRLSSTRGHHLRGPDGVPAALFQIDVWSATYELADRIGSEIRRVVEGTADAPVVFPCRWGQVRVRAAWVNDVLDDFSPPELAEEVGIHRRLVEVLVFYEE